MIHNGIFTFKHYRQGKLIDIQQAKNGVTNLGAHLILDGIFNGGSIPANWYLGLIGNTGYTFLSNIDTMASHSGWIEYTSYAGNRKSYTTIAAASRRVTNSVSKGVFVFSTLGVIRGAFLTTDVTKGGTAGTLLSTSLLGGNGNAGALSLVVSDEIELEYDVYY